MLSLQAITVQNILNNLVINDETAPIIEQFIFNYLDKNHKIADKYLNKNGLYHVFARQRDPFIYRDEEQGEMELIKTFLTQNEATEWVLENGQAIIEEQDTNGPEDVIVLTIIHSDNSGLYSMGTGPNSFSCVSLAQHESFAFSRDGYLMLLKEHLDPIKKGYFPNTYPSLTHFIKRKGVCLDGVSLIELCNIDQDPTLDDYNRQILNDILEFYA